MVSRLLCAGLLAMTSLTGMAQASEGGHEALPPTAPIVFSIPLPGGIEIPFSNSLLMLVILIVVLAVTLRLITRNMSLIPGRWQNLVECFFEKVYSFIEGMLGPRLTKKYFWYFGTTFTVILLSNYMGLLPGVGIFTYTNAANQEVVLFRGANADMNITVFLGFSFAILWFYWSIREQGLKHFLLHIFGPKGNYKGFLGAVLLPIFIFVGLIDCLSIMIRPVALAARLFGNIYAGESIIETMSVAHPNPLISWMFVLPFYGMELLVGFIQALVFLLLTVVFLKLQVGDEEHEEEESVFVPEGEKATPES